MPKKTTLLSFALLLLVIVGAAVAFLLQRQKAELDSSSEGFAVEITLTILEGSLETFEVSDDLPPSNSVSVSAQLLTENSDESLQKARSVDIWESSLASDFRLLGGLVSMDSITGESIPSRPLIGPDEPTANYLIFTSFTKGNATVEVDLAHKDDRWWITGFEISSDSIDY